MSAMLVALFAVASVATARPFVIYNRTSQGAYTASVTFNDGATVIFRGTSTNISTLGSEIDNLSGCSQVGMGTDYYCNVTGPVGITAIEAASDVQTLSDRFDYHDGASTSGYQAYEVDVGSGRRAAAYLDTDDYEEYVEEWETMECTVSNEYWCQVDVDAQANIVGCSGAAGGCYCVDIGTCTPEEYDTVIRDLTQGSLSP